MCPVALRHSITLGNQREKPAMDSAALLVNPPLSSFRVLASTGFLVDATNGRVAVPYPGSDMYEVCR